MRVKPEDIEFFNELYVKCKNYSEIARITGFSASTVRKYVKKDYIPKDSLEKVLFDRTKVTEKVSYECFKNKENWDDLLTLSQAEKDEIKELQREILF